jgi:hypothetical protein
MPAIKVRGRGAFPGACPGWSGHGMLRDDGLRSQATDPTAADGQTREITRIIDCVGPLHGRVCKRSS